MPNSSDSVSSTTRRRIFTGVVTVGVLAGLATAAYELAQGRFGLIQHDIKIGVLAPISGFMSGHGNSIQDGAIIAAEHINREGGILGHQVKLVIRDTKSDPATAAQRARELVGRDHVDFMIGTGTSAETLAAIPEAERSGTPFFYSLDGEDKTCRHGAPTQVAPMIWGTGFTERMAVRPLLSTLANSIKGQEGKVTVYFIGGDYVYPRTTNAYAIQIAKELGLKVVGDEYSDTSTQDYTPVIRRIAAAQPDLVIVTNPGASGVTFMKQARQLGLDKSTTISGFATFDQEALTAMGDASDGVYVINRYARTLQNPANAEFVAAYRTKFPKDTTLPGPTAAAGAYGAIMTAKAGYDKAHSDDRAKFVAALNNLEVDLPQGHIKVNGDTHVFEQPLYVMQIKNGEYNIVSTHQLTVQPGFEGCSVK